MFGSQSRPGMRGGIGLFDSRTRPGMRGSYMGDDATTPAKAAGAVTGSVGLMIAIGIGLLAWSEYADRKKR